MMIKIKSWLQDRFLGGKSVTQRSRKTIPARMTPAVPKKTREKGSEPELVDVDPDIHGSIESIGPGKNVLIRNRLVREETGTHDTLKIVDDSIIETGEETGIDPYNTGGFDRSKKWDQRFRK